MVGARLLKNTILSLIRERVAPELLESSRHTFLISWPGDLLA